MRRISSLLPIVTLAACTFVAAGAEAATTPGNVVRVDRDGACTGIESDTAGFSENPLLAYPSRIEKSSDPAESATVDGTTVVGPSEVDVRRELAPGDAFTCMVTIRNRHDERMTFDLVPAGIRGSDDGTDILDIDDPDVATTAASWLDPERSTFTLDSLDVVKVPVTVTVPPNPPVGAAYAYLLVKPRQADGGGAVGVDNSIGVAFELRVGGEGAAELDLRDADAPRLRWNRDSFTYRAKLANTGTLHARPRGRVRVRSIFGSTVANLGISGRTLLPGGSQPVATTWKGVPFIGFYRYDVRVTTVDGSTATDSGWFIALPPWWVIALVLVVLVLLVGGAVVRRRREVDWRDYLEDEDA